MLETALHPPRMLALALALYLAIGTVMVSRALPEQVDRMHAEGALETLEDRARLYLSALASVILWPADLVAR